MQDISPELAESFRLPTTNGTLIAGVQPGGPAERAGVRRGDILVAVESQEFSDATEMLNLIAALEPGNEATLKILRDRPLVKSERSGAAVYYSLTDPSVIEAYLGAEDFVVER